MIKFTVAEDRVFKSGTASTTYTKDDKVGVKVGVKEMEILDLLKENGIIKREGNNKKGFWKINFSEL